MTDIYDPTKEDIEMAAFYAKNPSQKAGRNYTIPTLQENAFEFCKEQRDAEKIVAWMKQNKRPRFMPKDFEMDELIPFDESKMADAAAKLRSVDSSGFDYGNGKCVSLYKLMVDKHGPLFCVTVGNDPRLSDPPLRINQVTIERIMMSRKADTVRQAVQDIIGDGDFREMAHCLPINVKMDHLYPADNKTMNIKSTSNMVEAQQGKTKMDDKSRNGKRVRIISVSDKDIPLYMVKIHDGKKNLSGIFLTRHYDNAVECMNEALGKL